jgi:hypothetical protein
MPTPTGGATAPLTRPAPQIRRWRAFAVLAISFFLTVVDLTIVNVALPPIGRDLHFTEAN